jgi:hypothetical protein
VPTHQLPEAALQIFNPDERAKNRSILQAKLSQMNRAFGPQAASQAFRELVSAVQTDMMIRSKDEFPYPEREFYKRVKVAVDESQVRR